MVDALTWGAFLDWAPPAKMEAAVTTQTVGELWPMVPGQEKGVHWLRGDASGGRLDGVSPDGGGWFGGNEDGANFHAYRPWTSQDRRDLTTLNGETSGTFLETVSCHGGSSLQLRHRQRHQRLPLTALDRLRGTPRELGQSPQPPEDYQRRAPQKSHCCQ